jgi:hypothetical protein
MLWSQQSTLWFYQLKIVHCDGWQPNRSTSENSPGFYSFCWSRFQYLRAVPGPYICKNGVEDWAWCGGNKCGFHSFHWQSKTDSCAWLNCLCLDVKGFSI